MALVLKDRVQETTTVTGDSPAVLLGEIAGYQSFANSTPNASVVYYTIAGGTEWEVGYGSYYTNNNSVVRVTSQVYASSNAGAIVNFTAGTKNIFVTLPAEQAIYQETNGDLRLVGGVIGLSIDGTEGTTLPNTSFQAFTDGNYYMQANQQNLNSGNSASADWVVTADNGSDTNNYMDMGMASSGYNYPDFSATKPNTGYVQSTGSELSFVAGKYGANVAAGNASSTDIVFTAGDLLVSGERARIKGSTGNIILSNTANPSDTGAKLQVTGNVTITGNTAVTGAVFSNATISSNNQLATKSYVDTAVSTGLHIHQPVQLAQSTNLNAAYLNGASGVGANLTNSGAQIALVVDTITANVADRILVFAQSNAVQNGVYVVTNTGSNSTNWVLTRASDADTYAPQSDTGLGGGDYFYVQSGATQAGDSYVCTNDGTITFGVTDITFTQFSGAITYIGSSPINVTGQTISLGGVVDETHGGTGLSVYNTGDMIYANAGNSLTNLTVGSTGQTLIVSGGAPAWGALDMAGSGVSGTLPAVHGGTGFDSYTIGELLYANASTTLAKVIPNNTTTQKVLTQTGNGTAATSTAWNQLSSADITGLGTMATQNASSVAITGGAINGTLIGNTTPSSGAFTTLSASSTVSGIGFDNYLNAPPSIGGVTPNTGAFTTLNATGLLTASANVNFDSGTLFVDSVNNRVGIGSASPAYPLDVQGNANATLVSRLYNANTGSLSVSTFQIATSTKSVSMALNYTSNWFQTVGQGGIVTSYKDFDTQNFRNNAGANQFRLTSTASANNYIQVTGGAGVGPTISAAGADTNVDIKLTPKGFGYANITSGGIKFPDGTTQATAAAGALSAGNSSIIINNVNITANATIAAGQNGFSVGPVTTANGVSVTVASGQSWVVI